MSKRDFSQLADKEETNTAMFGVGILTVLIAGFTLRTGKKLCPLFRVYLSKRNVFFVLYDQYVWGVSDKTKTKGSYCKLKLS